jgi:hypothetical protein
MPRWPRALVRLALSKEVLKTMPMFRRSEISFRTGDQRKRQAVAETDRPGEVGADADDGVGGHGQDSWARFLGDDARRA